MAMASSSLTNSLSLLTEPKTIQVSTVGRDSNIALIKFNRPNVLNALNPQLVDEFTGALESLENNENIRVIVVTGNGKAFSVGADVKEFQNIASVQFITESFLKPIMKVMNITKPIIAAVNGYAIGGGLEIALMCDIVYASTDARFALPETVFGLIPGYGGTQRITRLIGKPLAMDMLLARRKLDAQEALRLNIVSRLFAPDELLSETLAIAEVVASNPFRGSELSKKAVNASFEHHLKDSLQIEKSLFLAACKAVEESRRSRL